jgi:molecular chaperone DnaK
MAEVTEAVKGEDAEGIRSKTERLQTAFHRVSEAMYERAQAAQQAETASTTNGASSDGDAAADEEVVDAEVVDEQK